MKLKRHGPRSPCTRPPWCAGQCLAHSVFFSLDSTPAGNRRGSCSFERSGKSTVRASSDALLCACAAAARGPSSLARAVLHRTVYRGRRYLGLGDTLRFRACGGPAGLALVACICFFLWISTTSLHSLPLGSRVITRSTLCGRGSGGFSSKSGPLRRSETFCRQLAGLGCGGVVQSAAPIEEKCSQRLGNPRCTSLLLQTLSRETFWCNFN